jgi:ABC-type transporter Mla MlaB component
MTVRITKRLDLGVTVLDVAGWLRSEDASALSAEYHGLNGPVALELSQLRSADATGVATLLEIASLGTELRGTSTYIDLLLSQRGLAKGSPVALKLQRSDASSASEPKMR